MKPVMILLLLWLSVHVQADVGAWSGSDRGISLSQRGKWAVSRPLSPPCALDGLITEVHWRYTLTTPIPPDLHVKLCAASRCADIAGSSGITHRLADAAAKESLRFAFFVGGAGTLFPPFQVVSNQVTVNYH